MICEQCHKENRSVAKFCKWCGQPMISQNLLDKLVGLDNVKQQLKTIVDTYAFLRSRKDIAQVRISVNAIIIGETGTGTISIRIHFHMHVRYLGRNRLNLQRSPDESRLGRSACPAILSSRPCFRC